MLVSPNGRTNFPVYAKTTPGLKVAVREATCAHKSTPDPV